MPVEPGRQALLTMVKEYPVSIEDGAKYEWHKEWRVWCSNGHVWESYASKVRWRVTHTYHYRRKWIQRYSNAKDNTRGEPHIQRLLDEAVERHKKGGWKVKQRR
jgi:hypothetical protein